MPAGDSNTNGHTQINSIIMIPQIMILSRDVEQMNECNPVRTRQRWTLIQEMRLIGLCHAGYTVAEMAAILSVEPSRIRDKLSTLRRKGGAPCHAI